MAVSSNLIAIRDGMEIYKVGRMLVAYERVYIPEKDDDERRKKAAQIVLKINPAIEAEKVRQERERQEHERIAKYSVQPIATDNGTTKKKAT
ncbi:hypothetical protein [Pelosinus sp. sgz500959]|uniref:hypothetical protein n=1 Tax=Pelosinus sp. sgz500959 TaxID=3242472 RepID=UPI00366C6CC7